MLKSLPLVATAAGFLTLPHLAVAGPVQPDGSYLNWTADQGTSPTFVAVPGASTRATVTTETVDGENALRIFDDSDTNWVAFNHTIAADDYPNADPLDDDYVTQIRFRLASGTAVSGRPLIYRERDVPNNLTILDLTLNSSRQLVWIGDGTTTLKDAATNQAYILPTDQWVTLTMHRTSATDYHVYINDGEERDLGTVTTTPALGAGTVTFIQFGTGLGANHKADIAFASFSIGEVVPEPATVGLLGVGASIIAFGRTSR